MAAAAPIVLTDQQQFVVDHVSRTRKNVLLFHETGTGKTPCAVACARALIAQGSVKQVVVICPLSVKKQWLNDDPEAKGWFNKFNIERHVQIIETINSFYNYWVSSSDSKKNGISQRTLLIIDETHLIRNTEIILDPQASGAAEVIDVDADIEHIEKEVEYESKFMRSLIEFSDKVRNGNGVILALTATPILHKPSDFSIYFRLLLKKPYDARKFAYNDIQFDARFKNIEHFKKLACGLVSYYKNVKTRARGWAPVDRTTVPVPLTDTQTQLYLKEGIERQEARKIQRQRPQDTFRVYDRRWFLKNSDKMQRAIEFILEHPDKKHVVYSNFVKGGVNLFKERLAAAVAKAAEPRLYQKLADPCIISSDAYEQARKTCVKEFNEGEKHVILLSAAGREGIDFKGATYMHILDLPWSKADVLQIEGRVSRKGAHAFGERVVIRTYICISDTIRTSDVVLSESIAKKEDAIAPYLQALEQVSIESGLPCPQIEEDVLRKSYYPDSKDLSYMLEIARLKTQAALADDDDVIPAKYADFPMPYNLAVDFRTDVGAGIENIRKGTTIKEYRNKYMKNLENAARTLNEQEFIIKKQLLNAKLEAVLTNMYAIIKPAKDAGQYAQPAAKRAGSEDDEVQIVEQAGPAVKRVQPFAKKARVETVVVNGEKREIHIID